MARRLLLSLLALQAVACGGAAPLMHPGLWLAVSISAAQIYIAVRNSRAEPGSPQPLRSGMTRSASSGAAAAQAAD